MAREDIFIRLQVDTSDGVQPVAALAREIDRASKELKEFKKETREQTVLTGEQATRMAQLESRLHGLRGAYREAKNEQSGLTDAGLRFRDKIGGAFEGQLTAGVQKFGAAVVASFALDNIVAFGKEIANLAAQNEQLDRRAQVVFGESLPGITRAAEQNANAIGLTQREYVALAASQQDVFDNLGLARDQTTQYLPKLLELSDGLADFAGLEGGAAEAADLLRAAVQGNVKGLTELGIPVKRSKEELSALADEIQRNQGVTREQAEALATIELVYDQVGLKVEAFGAGQETLADKQDKANAKFRESKEALADALAPAFAALTEDVANYSSALARALDSTESFTERSLNLAALFVPNAAAVADARAGLRDAIDNVFASFSNQLAQAGENADISGIRTITEKLKGLLAKAIAEGDEATAERLKAFFAPGGAIEKAIQSAGSPKVSVPINLDIDQGKILTVGTLREELKKLREAREELSATDTQGLAENAAQITALEQQIGAIDGKTKATEQLTEAQREKLALEQEMAALAAQPITPLETNAPAAGGGLALATTEGATPVEGADPAAILAQEDSLQSQLAALRIQYQEGDIATFGEYLIRKNELEVQAANKSIAEEERVQQVRQAVTQQALGQAASLFNSLANMAEENSEEQKALATVAALINTYQGATAALAAPDVLPQPFAIVLKLLSVAAVIASGLSSVKKIQGFAQSGVVKRTDGPAYRGNPGDTMLVSAYPGEMYLNPDHQQKIRERAGYDVFSAVGVPGASSSAKAFRQGVGGLRGALSKVRQSLGTVSTGIPGFATSGVVPSISGAQLSQINVTNAIAGIDFQPRVLVDDVDRGLNNKASVTELSTL